MERIRFHFENIFFNDPLSLGPYRILQVGDLAASGTYTCDPHTQRCHEISYIVSGKADFVCGKETVSVAAGDSIFNPKDSLHAIFGSAEEPLRYEYIAFEIVDTARKEEEWLAAFFDSAAPGKTVGGPAVAAVFQEILENLLNRDEFFDRLTEDALRRLLIYTKREFAGDGRRVRLPESGGDKNQLLSRICRYIDQTPEDIRLLSALPERCGYSYSYLSGLFSKRMGMSLREYYRMRRHEQACKLLEDGISVTAVAEKQGYSSVHAFSHAFTAREGVPPSIYAGGKQT